MVYLTRSHIGYYFLNVILDLFANILFRNSTSVFMSDIGLCCLGFFFGGGGLVLSLSDLGIHHKCIECYTS